MPENKFYDYLIVGQGLAGSLLAWRLINHGKSVLVLDDGHASASSMVAAGVINPLAGKRFNHAPQIHDWLEYVETTYTQLAQQAKEPFLQWVDMLRLFHTPEQQRFYARLPGQEAIGNLLGGSFPPNQPPQPVQAPLGGFTQHRTGFVRLPALLHFLARWLREHQALHITTVNHEALEISTERVCYGGFQAGGVVFCDGYRSMHSPWFGYLPFAPDQGEILTLAQKPGIDAGQLPDKIINGAQWLLPIDNGMFRLGSTHNHNIQNHQPAREGTEKLLQGMSALLNSPQLLQLVRSEAGVRPATSDRQPFLGTHPSQPRAHIFNGFGAHGSLMIPWYSEQMCRWLIDHQPLPETADIARHGNEVA
ncbi:NAD(P)/FAD-dependent oxidoreductase [Thiolapillus sp.]